VEFPVSVALARSVASLSGMPGLWWEPKCDDHRLVLWRERDGVRQQSKSGNDVTSSWPDLAEGGMSLPVGTVLDGEGVVEVGDG
jgi:ATP-dependent DNA ligase